MIRAIFPQERPRRRILASLTASGTFFGLPSRFPLHARSVAFGIQAIAFLNVRLNLDVLMHTAKRERVSFPCPKL